VPGSIYKLGQLRDVPAVDVHGFAADHSLPPILIFAIFSG
jgi:hypothetical protein